MKQNQTSKVANLQATEQPPMTGHMHSMPHVKRTTEFLSHMQQHLNHSAPKGLIIVV